MPSEEVEPYGAPPMRYDEVDCECPCEGVKELEDSDSFGLVFAPPADTSFEPAPLDPSDEHSVSLRGHR